jgi:hypothetical protein
VREPPCRIEAFDRLALTGALHEKPIFAEGLHADVVSREEPQAAAMRPPTPTNADADTEIVATASPTTFQNCNARGREPGRRAERDLPSRWHFADTLATLRRFASVFSG